MSTYTPRYTQPSTTDINWININYGGRNSCIVRDKTNGSVMPNCTGYAWGRCLELNGTCSLPTINAGLWYANSPTYSHGTTPKLGAVICYAGGSGSQYSKLGHVAIVEHIADDGTLTLSESNYSGGERYFVVREVKPSDNYHIEGSGVKFQGFIYLGDWSDGGDTPPSPDNPPTPAGKRKTFMLLLLKRLRDKRGI